MLFKLRGAAPLVALACVLLSSMSADAKVLGIPKSAPAFTKYVARFIQEAMPEAKVAVIGRLRLDVEAPHGGHTTDLHNVYSVCRRTPDICGVEVTAFVGQMVVLYKQGDTVATRDALRIVVRPSAYLAAIHANPKRNKPLAAPLAGDYWMIAAIDQPTTVAMMDENDLPALKLSAKDALSLAIANTRASLRQSLQKELAMGSVRGMLDGDYYVSNTAAFPDLWAPAAHAFKGNLLIAIPAGDVVLYADGNKPGALTSIVHTADDVIAHAEKPFSDSVFRWSPKGWLPVATGGGR
jgi:hypothetical protein